MKRNSRIKFYRRVRAALLATNKRTDNSIITECNIVMPLVNSKSILVDINKNKCRRLQKVKKITNRRFDFNK